jgi:hypothetical protein
VIVLELEGIEHSNFLFDNLTMKFYIRSTSFVLCIVPVVNAFSNALFQEAPTAQQKIPSRTGGVDIELPNFDELFGRIQQVSPLSRLVIDEKNEDESRGFEAIDKSDSSALKWKKVEANKGRIVHSIEKIDNFQGLNAPLLRFRSSLKGPCDGEAFANFIMNLDDRKKWDAQIDNVYQAYPIDDLEATTMAMGLKYGDCVRCGIGHCVTKPNFGIDAREQLTLCGINEFDDGSSLVWGTEMESWHDHLLPPGRRVTRSKSHLFSTSLIPTGPETFDVEYVLQLDIGGKIPTWMTTPIVIDNVKKMFNVVQDFFLNKDGELEEFLADKAARNLA